MSARQPAGWEGIPTDRVVAVVGELANGLQQAGSGYLVGGRTVLTAQHCTRNKKKAGEPLQALRVIRASDGTGPRRRSGRRQ